MIPSIQTNTLEATSRLRATALKAMPRLVSDQHWPIADPEVNQATKEELLKTAKHIETLDSNKLYQEGTVHDGSYFLIHEKSGFISYYMEYELHAAHFDGSHSVTQTSVWRSLSPANPRGIAAHVFFRYLIPKYPAVMSDKIQTDRGRDFWIDLMSQALDRGFEVQLASMITKRVFPIESDEELRSWAQDKASAWGWGKQYEDIRFLIKRPKTQ